MKNKVSSLLTGTSVLIIVMLSSIYTIFRNGNNCVVDTAVLSFLILTLLHARNKMNVVCSDIFARASISAITTIASYFAAIYFLKINLQSLDIIFSILLFVFSGILGIEFFDSISSQFIDEKKYIFPQQKPRITILKEIDSKDDTHVFSFSMVLSALISSLFRIFHIFPSSFKVNDNFSIDPSIVTVSSGYFIGMKNILILLIGTIYSLVVLFIFHSPSYAEHLQNPYIYSLIIGFSLSQGLETLFEYFTSKDLFKFQYGIKNLKNASTFILLIMMIIVYMFFFSGMLSKDLYIPWWIFLVIVPFSTILSISTINGIAETGYWVSVIDDLLPLLIVILFSNVNLFSVIICISGLSIFEVTGIYYIINRRVGNEFQMTSNKVKKISFCSILVGIVVGMAIVLFFCNLSTFLSSQLPAPLTQVFALQIETVKEAISKTVVPNSINMYIFMVSFVVAWILCKKNISPIIILSGIMLPYGTVLLLFVGGLLSIKKQNKNRSDKVFSGLALGDGTITAIGTFIQK